MNLETLILETEALVFASPKPINAIDITQILNDLYPEEGITIENISPSIEAIKDKYDSEFHAFQMVEAGGGFQFLTKHQYHTTIAKLNGDKFLKRLSTAALETLAIIAYKQPITKPDIEQIRGVNCDYSIQKLLEKELIVISGRNEDAVGKPLLYATSTFFMDYLGINSMEDLPKLKEVFAEAIIEPTNAFDAIPNNNNQLVVDETGELKEIENTDNSLSENLEE